MIYGLLQQINYRTQDILLSKKKNVIILKSDLIKYVVYNTINKGVVSKFYNQIKKTIS